MIIKRKLNSDLPKDDKLFSFRGDLINSLLKQTEGAAMEIMKAIEFKKISGDDKMVDHWINIASGILARINSDTGDIKFHMGFIGALSNRDISNLLGSSDILEDIRSKYRTQIDFIKAVKQKLRKEVNKGQEKYTEWLNKNNGFLVSDKDYINYFKFITLCLSGIIDIFNDDDYSEGNGWRILDGRINSINIPEESILKIDRTKELKESIKPVLKECINRISENITYPVIAQSQNKKRW